MNPSELENGTEVYFELGTGSVFKGTIVGRDELKKQYAYTDYTDESNLVRVEIDLRASPSDDGWPEHMAPEKMQPTDTDGALFRDAYTIDAEEQHYIVAPENLVEVLD